MTAALVGGEWSAARPGRILPPGKTRYPFYRRLGGPQGRSGHDTVRTGKSYTMHGMYIMNIFKEICHKWWNLGLWLWCRNKIPVFTVCLKKPHPDPKGRGKFGPMWKWCWLCFSCEGCNSLWISILWPDGEQGILSEGDEKAEKGSEETKRSDLCRGKNWLLHHANASAHSSLLIRDFLTQIRNKF